MKLAWPLFFAIWVSFASADGRKERKRGRGRGEGYRVMDGHRGGHRGGMRGRGGGKGRGKGRGRWGWGWGQGRGKGDDVCMQKGEMMGLIHDLMDNSGPDGNIVRDDVNISTTGGIESYTYSTDPEVGGWIQTHVYQMKRLMESESCGIRMWDAVSLYFRSSLFLVTRINYVLIILHTSYSHFMNSPNSAISMIWSKCGTLRRMAMLVFV